MRALDGYWRVVRRRGIVVDETARWEAEATVRQYSDFVEGIPIALVVIQMTVDPDGSLELVLRPPTAANALARDLDDRAIGHRIADLISVTDAFSGDMSDVVASGEPHDEPFVQLAGVDEIFDAAVPLPDRCVGISLE